MSSMNPPKATRLRRAAGFSLVELMVAMVIGLVVIGAVIALVLSMIRANNQTIAATRLTQELRATAALMAADLRRSGGVADPMIAATAGPLGTPQNNLAEITIPAAPGNTCIRYAYEGAEGGNFRSMFLANAAVHLEAAGIRDDADCAVSNEPNSRLSSQQVLIVDPQKLLPGIEFRRNGRRIDITIRGCLSNRTRTDCDDPLIQRTLTQTVFVRSGA